MKYNVKTFGEHSPYFVQTVSQRAVIKNDANVFGGSLSQRLHLHVLSRVMLLFLLLLLLFRFAQITKKIPLRCLSSRVMSRSRSEAKKRQINYSANRLMTPYRVLFIKVNLPHFHNYLHSIFHICGETSIEK